MQGQKRDSVINSFPYPKTLGVSQISVCSLQYDTDGMLTLKTSTDQVLQSPSADSRENGSKDAPRACSRCRARSSVQPCVYTAANSRGAWAHLTGFQPLCSVKTGKGPHSSRFLGSSLTGCTCARPCRCVNV